MINKILNRKSIRFYNDKPISDEIYSNITKVINSSATSINGHAFSAIVIKDENVKKEISISNFNQQHIIDAQAIILFVGDLFRTKQVIDFNELTQPFKDNAILTASIDATIAASDVANYLLSENIGSCYIGGVRQFPMKLKKLLNLNENVFPVVALTIGYYQDEQQHQLRPKLNKTFNEKYDQNTVLEELKKYDEIMLKDYMKRDIDANWTQNTYKTYKYTNDSKVSFEFSNYLKNIKNTENNTQINIIGTIQIQDTLQNEIGDILKSLQNETLKEDGCLDYSWYQSLKDSSIIHVTETWANKQALQSHSNSKHMNEFKTNYGKYLLSTDFSLSKKIL